MAQQPEQPATSQAPPPEQRAATIAAALAVGATAAAGGAAVVAPLVLTAAMLSALTRLFLRWRYPRPVVRYAIRVTTRIIRPAGPDAPSPAPGPAELANARAARTFAAWFLERTTARVKAGYDAGMAAGEPEAREERYVEQHLEAQQRRREAARKVDQEAAKPDQVTDRPARNADGGTPGDPDGMLDGTRPRVILKWRAHPDDKVTPECRAADGAWFYADTPPIIGYPGMPHGGTCRCWPAHAGSLAEVARGRHVNEAVRAIIVQETEHRAHPGTDERQTA